MFDQKQVQEFKEVCLSSFTSFVFRKKSSFKAFNLMDQDRDGSISLDDLKEVYASLGRSPKHADLKQMLDEAGGPVNFTKLLQLFGDRLNGKKKTIETIKQKNKNK